MARQEIILGTPPAGLGGDPPRTASMKINAMTQELYDKNATLGTASTRNAQASSMAGKDDVLVAGSNGIGIYRDLRNTPYMTGTPRDINGSGTTIGFGDANVLGIPGYTSFRYGVLHSNIQFTDPSGGEAMSQTFEMFDETWRRQMLNLDTWGSWFLVGGRTQVVSNANGEAWLYADGTMKAVANLDGSGFANSIPAFRTWTYPRAFVGAPPKVLVTMSRPSLDITALAARTYTPGLASVQMAHNSTAQAGCTFVCLAMGRWK